MKYWVDFVCLIVLVVHHSPIWFPPIPSIPATGLLMGATNSGVTPPMITFNTIQPGINVSNAHSEGLLSQTRPALTFITPGMAPVARQNGLSESQILVSKPNTSMYPMNYSSAPINDGVSIGRTARPSSPAASFATATQSGKEYDFSSLMPGMFSKQ